MERYLTMLWVWLIVIYYYSARNARIASAVLAQQFHLSVRLSVCLSVTRRYCVKTTTRGTVQLHRWIAKCV